MKRFLSLFLVLVSCTLVVVPIAHAQMVDEEEVGNFTVGGVLGLVGSGMQDVNDNLGVVNAFLSLQGDRHMDKISLSGLSALDVRYKLRPNLALGFAWGALQNRSEIDVEHSVARFFSRATTYSVSAFYHVPQALEWNERLQVYAGAGYMLLKSGRVEWSFEDGTDNDWLSEYPCPGDCPGDYAEIAGWGSATATGSGYHLSLGTSYQLTYRLSAAFDFGYRNATLDEFTYNDEDFLGQFPDFTGDVETREPGDWAIYDFFFRDRDAETPDGRKRQDRHGDAELGKTGCRDCPLYYKGGQIDVDYSGMYAQIALRLHLF